MNDGLKLIGAAFPRTGTMSLKRAFEILGFGKCYHMHEVFLNPDHIPVWNAIGEGVMPDWRKFLAGYTATLDVPACLYWKELAHTFPDAKVLLLQRDPEEWYESMYSTVFQIMIDAKAELDLSQNMVRRLFLERCMCGRFEDRDYAIATYQRYCADVIAEMGEDRLLIYEVSQGWEPLCDFLGYNVPAESFPLKNSRERFCDRNKLT
jgi:hypothetical protein